MAKEASYEKTAEQNKLLDLHAMYIHGTPERGPVKYERVLVAHLAKASVTSIQKYWTDFDAKRVYVSTYTLKHIFDKRQAQEYDAILLNIIEIINQPDTIFENLDGRRGELAFIKTFLTKDFEGKSISSTYFCSLEIAKEEMNIVTAFRFRDVRRKGNYLKKYKPLWNWEDGRPPS
ncbi:MAG: PBECR2 nuclease fold domain-containing protein [bacterium]|nr:PBECR2 nuclease fold domain-containing protein [bacterium]